MLTSKVSVKGQTTVPAEIRRHLGIRPGDSIAFAIERDRVIIRKVSQADAAFLKLAAEAFSDWNTPEADEAFRDL